VAPASGTTQPGGYLEEKRGLGTRLGLFCSNYVRYFRLTWLPRHPGRSWAAGFRPFGSGGASATTVRKSFCVAGLRSATVLLLPSAPALDPVRAMPLLILILASFVFGLYTANLFAVTQTWAGIVAPIVTGFISTNGDFYFAFVRVPVLLLVGAISYLLIIPRVAAVPFRKFGCQQKCI
jgi:hypothetical protein